MDLWRIFAIYEPGEFAAAAAIVLAGGLVRGLTGFGAGLVMVPLLTLLWGPVEAIGTMVGIGMISLIQIVPPALRVVPLREVAPLLAGSALLTPVGIYFLVSLDPQLVTKIIAVVILAVTATMLAGWTYRGPQGALPGFIAGGLTGFINGVAGAGGPITVVYVMSAKAQAQIQRASIILGMGLSSFVTIGGLIVAGSFGQRVLTHVVVFALPAAVGTWAGAKLFHVLPADMFRRIVLWFLVAVGLAILLR
jgi:uncharacterized membrane protein YfcA